LPLLPALLLSTTLPCLYSHIPLSTIYAYFQFAFSSLRSISAFQRTFSTSILFPFLFNLPIVCIFTFTFLFSIVFSVNSILFAAIYILFAAIFIVFAVIFIVLFFASLRLTELACCSLLLFFIFT
jgi:hypothetical protein